jgi:hypothetical protein
MPDEPYPLQVSVDYPERDLNRVSTALRIFAAIPIVIVLATLAGHVGGPATGTAVGGGILFLPTLLMIVFRRKYPRWWFDWNLELLRFTNRVAVYIALMDDRYPSTDERQSVQLDFSYPDAQQALNRWLPLVKWFLAIPHYIVLLFLWIAAIVVGIVAWFAILITRRYPRDMFDFIAGVMRWQNRVGAYAFVLITDRYPPFRLGA